MQRIEMEAVKRERAQLLAQLARAKSEGGKAGGDAQQEDIRRLRRDLSLKKDKLNDIRRVRHGLLEPGPTLLSGWAKA